ncbi:class I SAM-dependent methyltransferase [Amycolatopsis regifaucium]|uniref:Methyltransferase type 11 n=1 Tax=Amycolatopsis regifaucium TaxID=546365 RepID=A0A154MGS3_9PSEU|nr:class I SAM-dependent methyltransferase [Amycolatopsis regifaucium]KZB83350.1 methyltransferase type 11 [Amycolatopsis regifaucium]OKA08816.1 SAM-dependent methyltransferase [Amycolatopsis regifaucium]SFI93642.1 Methyltransferase domain-containing protein [Amycolatopsis regifaucium]
MNTDWKATFTATFGAPASAVSAEIWAEVYGDDYPAELDTYSFVTRTDLHRIATEARLEPGGRLADIGCGRGGPGLWVAARTYATLTGVDIAETALASARRRAEAMDVEAAEFHVGSFADTGLDDASFDAVMSVDALLFAPDKQRACAEFARILAPGGRLLVTTWDFDGQPENRPPQVPDHRPLLESAGFEVLSYEETPDWRARQQRTAELSLERVADLAAESGADPAQLRASIELVLRNQELMTRRVLVIARV